MVTRRDGRCIWLREAIAADEEDAPRLEGNLRVDVCIVGGGYAGLWTSIEIKRREPSTSVSIIEADICGGGASGRNSGMVLPQWAKFEALEELCGRDGALAICRASERALCDIEALGQEHGIASEFRRDGWIWGATCEAQVGSWATVCAALERAGEQPFRPLHRSEIEQMTGATGFIAGVHMPAAATLHPGKWVRGIRRLALSLGVQIFENSPMTSLDRHRPPKVRTALGSVTAERVVLTMNAWSCRLPELRPGILVIASDDAITPQAPELVERSGYRQAPLMTDSQTFVTGFRTTADHRVNAGVTGGEIGFGTLQNKRFEGRSRREEAIRACLHRGHPTLAGLPFTDSWSGPIDRTRNGLPLFGPLSSCPDIIYGYGYSGNGVATTLLGGRILAALALGKKDEWSQCGLVHPVDRWMPPEPAKYFGALLVRQAIRDKDRFGYQKRKLGPVRRRLAALAPGGVVTTRLSEK